MKAIITGGGTGGHIYPALAIALKMRNKGWELHYVGSKGGLENEIIPKYELPISEIEVAPIPREISPAVVKALFKSTRGYFQARRLLQDNSPDVVLGTGGFVAGPVVMAASNLGIPTVIHEQNVYPGITNRLLALTVDKIALNFRDARGYFPRFSRKKCLVTGNPIRKEILSMTRKEGLQKLNLDTGKKNLLVFGGSQGAKSINKAMRSVCSHFAGCSWIQIIYITGEKNYQSVIKEFDKFKAANIKIMPYLHNMEWAYAASDLVVYRAGATGLAEITGRGLPAILIPYPYATGDHQTYNARAMEKAGAAVVIADKKLNGELLIKNIEKILSDKRRLNEMAKNSKKLGKPNAVENIYQATIDLIE